MKLITRKKLLYFFIGLAILISFFYYQNNVIVTTEYSYSSKKIPENFNGFKIVQLSDLHGKSFGKNQKHLINKVKIAKPNLIVFTGDLIDAINYNEENSLLLMGKLVQIAPVYYVTGNHEWKSGKYNSLEAELKKTGVHVMRNAYKEIVNGKDKIFLLGIDDPTNKDRLYSEQLITEKRISNLNKEINNGSDIKILLSHRPELLSSYSKYNINLAFTGHAHGGQFRIPFAGGLIAPNQGFFPKYTSGEYTKNNTTMIVNRGLGNSIIPIRIFNQPEIVVLTFKKEDS